jgi:uncharacterized protein
LTALETMRQVPVRQFLLKVASRCNLACDYCYVYRHADQSWRGQPKVMSKDVIDLSVARIAEHAFKHDLPLVVVILHGGEPLLAGPQTLDYIAARVRRELGGHTRVALGVQTNAVLLDETFLDVFARHRIQVGVSLDGPAEATDRHRLHADGRGSHAAVVRGLNQLRGPRFAHLFGGLLSTVDLLNDPTEVYEHLLSFAPPEIDFLLPHGTWDRPPPGRDADQARAPYADWLITIFDRWFDAPRHETRVRLFESIISLLLGGPSGSEAIGLDPVDLATVETDGSLELVDTLKVTSPGQAATGLHVAVNSFDEYLEHPGVRARQAGLTSLSRACQACPVVNVCGGGLYPHRYQTDGGFSHPSVYCADLAKLIRHVAGRLARNLTGVGDRSTRGQARGFGRPTNVDRV